MTAFTSIDTMFTHIPVCETVVLTKGSYMKKQRTPFWKRGANGNNLVHRPNP